MRSFFTLTPLRFWPKPLALACLHSDWERQRISRRGDPETPNGQELLSLRRSRASHAPASSAEAAPRISCQPGIVRQMPLLERQNLLAPLQRAANRIEARQQRVLAQRIDRERHDPTILQTDLLRG